MSVTRSAAANVSEPHRGGEADRVVARRFALRGAAKRPREEHVDHLRDRPERLWRPRRALGRRRLGVERQLQPATRYRRRRGFEHHARLRRRVLLAIPVGGDTRGDHVAARRRLPRRRDLRFEALHAVGFERRHPRALALGQPRRVPLVRQIADDGMRQDVGGPHLLIEIEDQRHRRGGRPLLPVPLHRCQPHRRRREGECMRRGQLPAGGAGRRGVDGDAVARRIRQRRRRIRREDQNRRTRPSEHAGDRRRDPHERHRRVRRDPPERHHRLRKDDADLVRFGKLIQLTVRTRVDDAQLRRLRRRASRQHDQQPRGDREAREDA